MVPTTARSPDESRWAAALPTAVAVALSALIVTVGADSLWLVAMGRAILHSGSVLRSVPYAAAPTVGWPNVPALAEVLFRGIDGALGERGLLIAQLLAVGAAVRCLTADMRRGGAPPGARLTTVVVVWVGAFAAFTVIRFQLFSLALFAALIVLLRSEARAPSRRIWLVPPLLALWSNLHGAVLVGLAVAGCYLVFERLRRRPAETLLLVAASPLALCLTPALWQTPRYYRGVVENEAARRGVGLWAPLDVASGLDLTLLAAAIVLIALALWARPRLWELVAMAGTAAATVHAARTGVWLLFLASGPAAVGLGRLRLRRRPRPRSARRYAPAVVVAAALGMIYGIARGPLQAVDDHGLVRTAVGLAHGAPVLAEDKLAEEVAAAGGTVWVSNPIDAFRRTDQQVYLDWLAGRPRGDAALEHTRIAVVVRGHPAQRRLSGDREFRLVRETRDALLYVSAARR